MSKKSGKLSLEQMQHLARAGAEATLHRLRAEIEVLERTFPELASSRGRQQMVSAVQEARQSDERRRAQSSVRAHEKVLGRTSEDSSETPLALV